MNNCFSFKRVKEELNKCYISDSIAIFSLFIFVGFACLWSYVYANPDSDSFWLIATGRWIVEHKSVPKINPWVYEENMAVIIQSPLCALFNYLWYSKSFSIGNLWQLAMIENVVLLLSATLLLFTFSKKPSKVVSTIILLEAFVLTNGLLTTRPYQLTIANAILLLYFLERHKKENAKVSSLIGIFICILFQANYQMASIFLLLCFIMCYFVEDFFNIWKKEYSFNPYNYIYWYILFALFYIAALLNPYGLDGVLYLFRSFRALSDLGCGIIEMQPPQTMSIMFLVSILVLALYILIKKVDNDLTISDMFMVYGTVFATWIARRNLWMVLVTFSILYIKFLESDSLKNLRKTIYKVKEELGKKEDRSRIVPSDEDCRFIEEYIKKQGPQKVPFIAKLIRVVSVVLGIAILFQMVSISCKNAPLTKLVVESNKIIDSVNSLPKDAKIYTTFNSGGYLEFCDRKIYIDARPELYAPEISKGRNILKEWYELEKTKTEIIPEYVENNDWQYYFVQKGTALEYYLRYSGVAKIFDEYENNLAMFQIVK